MTESTAPAATGRRRDLNLYWWGQTTSAFGSVFTAIAMPIVAVINLKATPAQVGLISAASVLPALLLGLPAGVLADRIARPRRTLIALDTLSALAVGAVALGVAHHVASIAWLIGLCLVQGCVTILSEIVYFIHLRQLTDDAGIGPARARLQAGEFGAGFVGRLLVGPTIVAFGAAAALCVDGISYVLSAVALLSMRPAARIAHNATVATGGMLRGIVEGTRFFLTDPFHRALLVFIVAPVAAVAGAGALTAPFLLRVAHIPTSVYGVIFAVSGLVGLAGSTVAGRLLRPGRDPRRLAALSFAASMTGAVLLPLSAGAWPLAACCAALGIGLPLFFGAVANVALSPVIVADVPEEAIGRTVATLQVAAAAAGLVGALAGGYLGNWLGPRAAIWAMDLFGLAAIAVSLRPALRSARASAGATAAPVAADDLVTAAGQAG